RRWRVVRPGAGAPAPPPMYLEYSPSRIVHHLLARGWLSFDDVLAGAVVLVPMGRLNSTYRLFRGGAPYLFIKQAAPHPDPAACGVAREAAFLALAGRLPGLAEHVPRLVEHDPERRLLLLELYDVGETELLPPPEGAAGLGRALAALHGHSTDLEPAVAGTATRLTHWTLQVGPKLRMRHQNRGQKELYALLLRNRELVAALSALEGLWEYEGVIHADAKWDNCILTPASGEAPPRVRLADWESVRVGDFAWDVAGILQDLWMRWIASMPLSASTLPGSAGAAVPLEDVARTARAFWDAYRSHAGMDEAGAERRLAKAVRFAAARMVQTASEQSGQLGFVGYSPVALLQFAHNVAARPDEARATLLGF
ncbi:MAG TPA: phosphotransferase, partial [Longimicrobium sp.]|nr:phosphotransferase [Longimicrobium sp.]